MEHSTVARNFQSLEDQSKTNTKPMMDLVGQWRTASTKLSGVVSHPSSTTAYHPAVIYNFTPKNIKTLHDKSENLGLIINFHSFATSPWDTQAV